MGVDAFVMPLWKYHVGDFETPLEASGLATGLSYVSAGGVFERQRWSGAWARWKAKRAVKRLAKDVSAANGGVPIVWRDDGEVAYSQQFRVSHEIQLYLWWYDRRDLLGQFRVPEEGDESERAFYNCAPDRPPSFPHLLRNGYHNDYFLPVDFERVAEVEPYLIWNTWPTSKKASSTQRALREIQDVDRELQIPEEFVWDETDPLSAVRGAFHQLREMLDLSQRLGLPVIFWG